MAFIYTSSVFLPVVTAVLSVFILKVYGKITMGRCRSKRDMAGKTVIVTSASTGIGKETAKDLARRNARVILCCRNKQRGEDAAQEIRNSTGNQSVVCKFCDLSSLKSVRQFADDILKNENRLDVLINNAAVIPTSGRHLTEEGLELTFATNHLGHFLLTNLLLPLLKKSAPSRIIVVSSELHRYGKICFDNLNSEKRTIDPMQNYSNTKLANILFAHDLYLRLRSTPGITVNSLHPGVVKTKIGSNSTSFWKFFFHYILHPFSKNPEEGAQTLIYLAVSEDVEGVSGKYFSDCKEKTPSPDATNTALGRKLWYFCEQMVGVTFADIMANS